MCDVARGSSVCVMSPEGAVCVCDVVRGSSVCVCDVIRGSECVCDVSRGSNVCDVTRGRECVCDVARSVVFVYGGSYVSLHALLSLLVKSSLVFLLYMAPAYLHQALE